MRVYMYANQLRNYIHKKNKIKSYIHDVYLLIPTNASALILEYECFVAVQIFLKLRTWTLIQFDKERKT